MIASTRFYLLVLLLGRFFASPAAAAATDNDNADYCNCRIDATFRTSPTKESLNWSEASATDIESLSKVVAQSFNEAYSDNDKGIGIMDDSPSVLGFEASTTPGPAASIHGSRAAKHRARAGGAKIATAAHTRDDGVKIDGHFPPPKRSVLQMDKWSGRLSLRTRFRFGGGRCKRFPRTNTSGEHRRWEHLFCLRVASNEGVSRFAALARCQITATECDKD